MVRARPGAQPAYVEPRTSRLGTQRRHSHQESFPLRRRTKVSAAPRAWPNRATVRPAIRSALLSPLVPCTAGGLPWPSVWT